MQSINHARPSENEAASTGRIAEAAGGRARGAGAPEEREGAGGHFSVSSEFGGREYC